MEVELVHTQSAKRAFEARSQSEFERRFERVADVLSNLDVGPSGVQSGRSTPCLGREQLVWVTAVPEHLKFSVIGAPTFYGASS